MFGQAFTRGECALRVESRRDGDLQEPREVGAVWRCRVWMCVECVGKCVGERKLAWRYGWRSMRMGAVTCRVLECGGATRRPGLPPPSCFSHTGVCTVEQLPTGDYTHVYALTALTHLSSALDARLRSDSSDVWWVRPQRTRCTAWGAAHTPTWRRLGSYRSYV